MTWAFLDDHAHENEKILRVGSATAWYWACGLMYCRRKYADRKKKGRRLDFIPKEASLSLFPDRAARSHVEKLVKEGLWLEFEGGYLVNDWKDVYGEDGSEHPEAPKSNPQHGRLTPAQLGGLARARSANRQGGRYAPSQPAGPAECAQLEPADASRLGQPEPAETTSRLGQREPASRAPGSGSGSGSGLNSDDLLPKDLKEDARGSQPEEEEKESGAHRIRPTNLESSLKVPVMERAQYAVARPDVARWLTPQAWPEAMAVVGYFAAAWGCNLGALGDYSRDSATRAVVALLAAFPLEAIEEGAKLSLRNPVIKNGNRALGAVTPEVLRRTLSGNFGGPQRAGGGPLQPDHGADAWAPIGTEGQAPEAAAGGRRRP